MKIKSGLGMHCYHSELFSWVYDYDERVAYIKRTKPQEEQELRLRLLKLVPENRLPTELVWLGKVQTQARAAYRKTGYGTAENKRLWLLYSEAEEAYDEERSKHVLFLKKLHEELCPDCPFDHETIFARWDEAGKWY